MSRQVPRARHVAWLGLGSNLDDPARHVRQAFQDLALAPDVGMLAASSLYRTAPVGGPAAQPDFCNACAAVVCGKPPLALLDALHAIEASHDRVRDVRWGPRTLDLDLLAFDDWRMDHPRLQLPHPRISQRAFVLVPLAEIAPALVIGGSRVIDHLRAVDCSDVSVWQSSNRCAR